MSTTGKPTLLVLASTYPRWRDDHEPAFVHELARRLAADFSVIALVPDAPGADADGEFDGVQVVRYRYAPRRWQTLVNDGGIATNLRRSRWKWLLVPGFVLGQYLAARRLMRARRVDLIHAHWLIPQGVIARALSRAFRVPYVVTSHGGDLFGFRGRAATAMKRRVAGDAAAMTVVSAAMRVECARLGFRPRRLDVIPMGVDLQERFAGSGDTVREDDLLLFVGRLVPKKGLPHLLRALPAILARRPAATLVIAGFGPEEDALKAQARDLKIEASVRFLGPLPQHELPALYRRASVFVAPFVRDESGNQEGLPVVLMEAIGCGCPVVVGNVAGVEELLGDEAAAASVDPVDTGALANAVLDVLADPQRARARAAAVLARATDHVDWSRVAQRYARVLLDAKQAAP